MMRVNRVIFIVLFIGMLFSLAAIVPGFARLPTTLVVDASGHGDYTSVKIAIQNSISGDTILVRPGTYSDGTSSYPISSSVTIMGDGTGTVSYSGKINNVASGTVFKNITFLTNQLGLTILTHGVAGQSIGVQFINCTESNKIDMSGDNNTILSSIITLPSSVNRLIIESGAHNFIINNTFINSNAGVECLNIVSCSYSLFYKNNFTSTSGRIEVGNSPGNTWYLNNFYGTSFLVDSSPTNINLNSTSLVDYTYNGIPHTGYMGNYWSGYTGVDDNGDGIGDSPYTVVGTSGAVYGADHYPLMAPFENYHINSPEPYPISGSSPTTVSSAGDWPQFQVNETHSGVTNSSGPVNNVSLAWTAKVNSISSGSAGVDVTPLVVGDSVFAYDCNGTLWAFNKTNGNLLWNADTSGGSLQTSEPAYGDGKLFAASYSGDVYAFDPVNRTLLWSSHVTDDSLEAPVTYSAGKLFIGDGLKDGVGTKNYYCINATDGSITWKYPVADSAGFIWDGSVVVGDYLVFPSFEGTLYSVNIADGTLADSVNLTLTTDVSFAQPDLGMIRSSLAYNNGYIYTTSENGLSSGYLFKIGFQDGQFTAQGWSSQVGFSTSTPVVYGGHVYVGAGEHDNPGKLACLDDSTGNQVWEYDIQGGVKSSPAVYVNGSNLHIYFTSANNNGTMYCVDQDGNLVWSYNPPDDAYILQGGVIGNGSLYFGTDAGLVYCLREASSVSLPDLSISMDTVTGALESSESLVNVTVTNSGPVTSRASHVALYADGALVRQSGSDYGMSIASIPAGGSCNLSLSWTPLGYGTVCLQAVVDPANEVAESDEYDNDTLPEYILVASSGPAAPTPVPSGASWPQFHNDVTNSGFTSDIAPGTDTLLWSSPDVGAVDSSSVVVAQGMVFVNGNKRFSALNMSDGSIVWQVPVAGDAEGTGSWSSPAYADGMVFLQADVPRWAANGTPAWTSGSLPWDTDGSPTIVDGIVVSGDWEGAWYQTNVVGNGYAGDAYNGHYFAFNETTGQQLWMFNASYSGPGPFSYGDVQGTPAYDNGKFFLTSWSYNGDPSGVVYCVQASTGHLIWQANLPGKSNTCGSPTVSNGTVYVTTYNFFGDGELYALSESDGSILWSQGVRRTDGTPAVAYGNVYVSGGYQAGYQTYAFNATTGDPVWSTSPSLQIGGWTASVAVADGKVYVGALSSIASGGSGFGYAGVYCLDAYTGNVIWSDPRGGSAPAIANGTLFTIANSKVYAYKDNAPVLPVANFSANVTLGAIPLTVEFTDNSTNATSWAWDFNNDGVVDSTSQNASYTYAMPGTYTVDLTVANSAGGDSMVKTGCIVVKNRVLYDGAVSLVNVTTFSFTADSSGKPYTVSRTTDMGALDATGLSYNVSDEYYSTMGFFLDGIDGVNNEDWSMPDYRSWAIVINGVPASRGIAQNNLTNGDVVEYYYTTTNLTTWMPDLVDYTFKVRITADISSSTPTPVPTMGDWPAFHMDSVNGGVTSESGPLSLVNGGATWAYPTSSTGMAGIDTVPIVGDGKIYTVGYNGYVYALNPDGTLAWKNMQIGGQDSFVVGNPVYHDGVLYVALYNGNATADTGIHAIDASDGSLIWSNNNFPLIQPVTPITYDDGNLYVGTWQQSTDYSTMAYYCVNAATGSTVWMRNSTNEGGYYWAGAAAIGNNLVYGDDAGHLLSVDKKTGTLKEDFDVSSNFSVTSGKIEASVAYDPGTQCVYFTSEGGYIYSLGFDTAAGTFDPSKKWDKNIGFSTSTPAIYDGKLYVSGGGSFDTGGNLYCLDEATGSILWTYTANGIIQSSPSVSIIDGKPYIYFTTNCADSTAYCLDQNGNPVWSYTPPASEEQYSLAGMAISDGVAYFGNDAGYLFALGSPVVSATPVADFSGSPLTGTVPLSVQFSDKSSGATSWAWDFDNDGLTDSTLQDPAYTYVGPGVYTVNLTVTNSAGSDSMVKHDHVTVNPRSSPSSASFTLDLKAGWNLVSIPLVNDSLWANQLKGTGILTVATYNKSTNGYDPYVVGLSPLSDNKQIVIDNAYYLLCDHDLSLTILGTKPSEESNIMSLSPGWNMVGWSSLNSSTAISLASMIPGNQTVARHNATTNGYDPYVERLSPAEDSFTLIPGEGYFILSDSTQQFDFGGV